MSLPRIVTSARQAFRNCLRERRLECVTELYHPNAVLKGTFATKPVTGHDKIRQYFQKFFKTVEDVKFDKDPIVMKKNDLTFVSGKYHFLFEDGSKVNATYELILTVYKGNPKIFRHISALNKCS